jgi:malate dehydrogenase
MVMALQKYSQFPKNKVVGMAGILDSSRYKLFLSEEFNVPIKKIDAMVMGGHGDTMVPLPGYTKIDGKKLLDLMSEGKITKEKIESINQRTRDGGAEIVKYLEKGSAYYAPAASGVEMAISYLKDEKKLIQEIKLEDNEINEFKKSVDSVRRLWEAAIKIDPNLER